jgi:hypothetical protein
MAITITWTGTLVTDNHYKVGQWYTDGVLSGDIQTPTDPEFNQLITDEQLIVMLEPVEYE